MNALHFEQQVFVRGGYRVNTTLRVTLPSSVFKRTKYTPEPSRSPASDVPSQVTVFKPVWGCIDFLNYHQK